MKKKTGTRLRAQSGSRGCLCSKPHTREFQQPLGTMLSIGITSTPYAPEDAIAMNEGAINARAIPSSSGRVACARLLARGRAPPGRPHGFQVLAYKRPTSPNEVPRLQPDIDDELSGRPLSLDPAGYFLVKLDRPAQALVAEYYSNTIKKDGACAERVLR